MFFWKPVGEQAAEDDADGRRHFVARAYSVFNAGQVDGHAPAAVPVLPECERLAAAERYFAAIRARVIEDAQISCFVPSRDEVHMVPFWQFKSAAGYYGVLAHELTHWSGAEARLNRDLSGRFGSESYAMEQMVAELSAAFIGWDWRTSRASITRRTSPAGSRC